MTVYFASPIWSGSPTTFRPPNSDCQSGYASTATRVPFGASSSAALK